MPVYEYRCSTCGTKFAALVGVGAGPDEARCPGCGEKPGRKLVSRPGRFRVEDDRIEEVADRLEGIDPDSHPGAVREAIRDVGKALDDDASDEIEALFEADQDTDA